MNNDSTIRKIGQHEALASVVDQEVRSMDKAFKLGLGAAVVGLSGMAAGAATDSGGTLAAGAGVLGGGVGAMVVAGTAYDRNRRRARQAEGIADDIDLEGGVVPAKGRSYYTLPDGRQIVPQGEFAKRFNCPDSETPDESKQR